MTAKTSLKKTLLGIEGGRSYVDDGFKEESGIGYENSIAAAY